MRHQCYHVRHLGWIACFHDQKELSWAEMGSSGLAYTFLSTSKRGDMSIASPISDSRASFLYVVRMENESSQIARQTSSAAADIKRSVGSCALIRAESRAYRMIQRRLSSYRFHYDRVWSLLDVDHQGRLPSFEKHYCKAKDAFLSFFKLIMNRSSYWETALGWKVYSIGFEYLFQILNGKEMTDRPSNFQYEVW